MTASLSVRQIIHRIAGNDYPRSKVAAALMPAHMASARPLVPQMPRNMLVDRQRSGRRTYPHCNCPEGAWLEGAFSILKPDF